MLNFVVGESELAQRIRSHPWEDTALGAPENWPESLKTLVTVMLAANQQMYVVWGPSQTLIYNDRYIEVLQEHHPHALGRPFLEVWSEIADDLRPLVENAYAGNPTCQDDILLWLERKGSIEETHFAYSYTPVLNASGGVEGFFCPCIETTEQVKAARLISENEERLRESEEKYRNLFETMRQGYCENELVRDADGRAVDYRTKAVNPQFERLTGIPAGEAVGRTARELVQELDAAWIETYDRVVRTGEPEQFEREEPAFGRWFEVQAYPLAGDRFAILYDDITERRRTDAALRESEERLRSAAQVGGLGLWDWNVLTGEVHWSDEHYQLQGYDIGTVTPSYTAWAERIHPDDRENAEEAIRQAMESRSEYAREFRTVHPDGLVHWLSSRGKFFYDEEGNPVRMIGAMVDTTERREAEERQALLLAELQHRVRNILAVVRSVFTRTAETERTVPEVTSHFTGRLDALARTQVLVTQSLNGLVDLEAMVRDEMLSVGSAENPLLIVTGPEVALPPKQAEAIGLAIHELTTNAIKYGALGQSGGALEISWSVNMDHRGPRRLVLNWIEQGVPAVPVIPSNQGFGSELIREALPYRLGAETELEFVGGGVRCRIMLDLPVEAKVIG